LTTADDKPQRPEAQRIEPPGKTIVHDGVEYRAYSLDEYKELKHLFVDYHSLWDYSLSIEDDVISMAEEIELWQFRVDGWKEESERQANYAKQLSSLFDKEHDLRLKLEKRNDMLGWVPWALVVVESVAIGVAGAYVSVKSSVDH
jgi:hypothetical protein